MNIAYRFRIYPTEEQKILLGKTFGCCRFLYNQMLDDKIREYEKTKKMLKNTPAMYKREYPFLKEVDSLALANVQLHLEKAYKNFFRDPKIGFPRFKSKHHSRNSYTTNVVNENILVESKRIRLPKLKWIAMKKHREQRKLSRCVRGSHNYELQKKKVARCHEKIRNQRRDHLHKLSRKIADSYDAVAVEDIDMKAMGQCLHFGKSVQDNGYGLFREMLEYKLAWQGKKMVKVDRFFPSSKKCCKCGRIKKGLKLSERVYHCECGNEMDRDHNAAINIREEARRMLTA